ncbi:MAG: hypothetical protein AAFO98_13730 [Pseudomonadota bacterium]
MQLATSIVEDLRAKLVYFPAPVPGLGTIGTVFENSNSNILHWFTRLSHSVRDDRARLDALLPVLDGLTHWARGTPSSVTPDPSTFPAAKRSAR